ncbi:hypothetical protein [Rhodococcus sp. LB1]|uniref:hypothetical protein n=1 Tax=Rhodococcus sp. LB1 TaxID=1807499 RepID=UPI00077AB54B|nr:hypothetical protein [Rhodococcus sp. LB1]KXX60258.1 hypothetical protein AZG88_38345 [Rhodococcus sp. LB1]
MGYVASMDVRQMEHLLAVVDNGGVNRAAEAFDIAALSDMSTDPLSVWVARFRSYRVCGR